MILHCHNNGPHTHDSLESASLCWGMQSLYVMGTGHPKSPEEHDTKATPATEPMLRYVTALGGSRPDAEIMGKAKCSTYIDDLKHNRVPKVPTPDTPLDDVAWEPFPEMVRYLKDNPPEEVHIATVAKRETRVPIPLLEMVPDGYFATQIEEGAEVIFLRITRPKHGRYKDCMKVQQQLGSGFGVRLQDAMIVWPEIPGEKKRRVDVYRAGLEEAVLLLIVDYRGAARLYSKERKTCCRCNTELTDARSRKYGIGPECEKYMPWMIDDVDAELAEENE